MRILSTEQLLKTRELSSFTNASVFGALQEESILWLLEQGEIRSMKQGECLFAKGQPGNSFHVILQGQVSYYKYHNGKYAYIREYCIGEQIGFMSLIALHDRVGRAECHNDTIALEIDNSLFQAFHNQYPREFGILMINLAREMARSLRSVDNLLVEKS
jgi:CRP-like cAMP-binding protein